jgi:sensor c-di-GMP phosphodiesterase-like protein
MFKEGVDSAASVPVSAKLPSDWEQQRLHVLHATGLLDGGASEGFDRITRMAQQMFGVLRDIPAALAHGEFRLVYQPKLDLRTLRYAGVEALIRWQHPRHGNTAPMEFIPLAENTPLIHLVTEWVLHTALAQLATWQQQGLALAVAVNVSARNLEHPGFLRMLRTGLLPVAPAGARRSAGLHPHTRRPVRTRTHAADGLTFFFIRGDARCDFPI